MRKYIKLTAGDAIAAFMQKDTSFAPETGQQIREQIGEILRYPSDNCVSVVIPTHRTRPDSDSDGLVLKNAVKEAEKMLAARTDKRTATAVGTNITLAQQSIDTSINYDCLVLYANEHFSTVVKLPVTMPASVAVGPRFDLRPLLKAMLQNESYYILTVSRKLLRLIESHNEKAVTEFDNEGFPFPNDQYYTTDPEKLMQDDFTERLLKEYFNTADKYFQKMYNTLPLPLIIAGDVKTVAYYESQMDDRRMVVGRLPGSYDQTIPRVITEHAYPLIKEYRKSVDETNRLQAAEAHAAGMLLDNPSQIYEAALEGRIDTLCLTDRFISRDHHEPVGGRLADSTQAAYVSNDLLEIIAMVATSSGTVIITGGIDPEISDTGIYAITRY